MSTRAGLVTFAEFEKRPDPPAGHYEPHHGEIVLVPPRQKVHMKVQQSLFALLMPLLEGRGFLTIEFAFSAAPEHEAWQADIGFVSQERWEHDDNAYFLAAPDLVIEVLSPGNTPEAIDDKMTTCMENGCVSFWIVDPRRRRVSVTEGNLTRH